MSLPWAWIESVFSSQNDKGEQVCREIVFYIAPIERSKAMNMMDKKVAMLISQAEKSHMAGKELENVQYAHTALLEQKTMLFELGVVVVIGGKDVKDTKRNFGIFQRNNRSSSVLFNHIPLKQGAIYYGNFTNSRVVDKAFMRHNVSIRVG